MLLYSSVTLLFIIFLVIISTKPIKRLWDERACQNYQIDGADKLELKPDQHEVKILILGDIGSGSEDQKKVARASEKTCSENGCDLALIAGDNFIQKGITCLNDEQLQTKFEKMYGLDVPFYAVLGNHDLKGNWKAQIEYTKHSARWNLPGTNYRLDAGPVHIQAINTTCSMRTLWTLFNKVKKPWHLVLGHHPVLSSGRHGGMTGLERWIIGQTNIDFFVSGHNHTLEHLKFKNLEQIVSGGGGSPIEPSNKPRLPNTKFYHEDFGYIWAKFTEYRADFHYYDAAGNEIYHHSKEKQGAISHQQAN